MDAFEQNVLHVLAIAGYAEKMFGEKEYVQTAISH